MAHAPAGGMPVLVLAPPRYLGPLGAMRSLSGVGARVYGLRHEQASIAGSSRHCAGTVAAGVNGRPGPVDSVTLEQLLEASAQLGEGTILVPGSDDWAAFLARHRESLRPAFRFPEMDAAVLDGLLSKRSLARTAQAAGVRTPRGVAPATLAEAREAADSLGYPVILKQLPPIEVDKGEINLVLDRGHLDRCFARMGGPGRVLVQERVPVAAGEGWTYNGYFDRGSRCLAAATARKLRQHPPGLGICTYAEAAANPEVTDAASRLLTSVGYRGLVDIDFVRDARDGAYLVLDVNPRLGGMFRAMVGADGMDVVRAMYLDLTGAEVPPLRALPGRRWLFETADLLACAGRRRSYGVGPARWWSELRRADERVLASVSDPGPLATALRVLALDTWRGRSALRRALSPAAGSGQPVGVQVAVADP